MMKDIDYSNTYPDIRIKKSPKLTKYGRIYPLYPLGTALYQPYGKLRRVKEFEIYGIEVCAAGVFYHIMQTNTDLLKTYNIPEELIGERYLLEEPD